jgi:hypothetical protein
MVFSFLLSIYWRLEVRKKFADLFTRPGMIERVLSSNRVIFQLHNYQITQSLNPFLLIRNHPFHFEQIAIAHQRGFAQVLFALLGFRRQYVAQAGVPTLHLAIGSFLEALRRAFVRFQFWHSSSKSADRTRMRFNRDFQI